MPARSEDFAAASAWLLLVCFRRFGIAAVRRGKPSVVDGEREVLAGAAACIVRADGAQAVAGHAPCEIEVGTLAWSLESYNLTLYNRKRKVEHASQGTRLVRFDNS